MKFGVWLPLLLGLALIGGLSWSCTHLPAGHQVESARPESFEDCHRADSERFMFFSDPWINLHHFLFQWARNIPQRRPDDQRPAIEVLERNRIGDLDESERSAWTRAVRFYRERLAARDIARDRDLIVLRDPLTTIACSDGAPAAVVTDMQAVLVEAMPVYRRHWWPGHLTRNSTWIEELSSALEPYETVLSDRLAEAYGGQWPEEGIRVDVTAYASWHGAYTTNRPNQITLASHPNHRGVRGVDLLFHEVSHASFFEQPLLGQLSAAFRAHGARPPNGLSHVIQFETPSELLRLHLRDKDLRGFQPFAEGLYRRIPVWNELRMVVEDHWELFLAGKLGRAEALDRIAAELLKPAAAG